MSVYPKWMEKRKCKIEVVIPPIEPPICPPSNGGGGGGGGATIPIKQPLPRVSIKKVIVMDDYEQINVTVLKVIDLSLNGGT